MRHEVHSGDALMFFAATPAAMQLAAVGLHQIEENLLGQLAVAGSASRQKQQRILFADRIRFLDLTEQFAAILELGFELGPHFRPDGVAAAMDAWADGRPEIAGTSAEPALHLAHAFLHDPFHRSPPARMEHSHRPALCVHQNDRQAIRGQNCQQETRGPGDQAVAGETLARGLQKRNE